MLHVFPRFTSLFHFYGDKTETPTDLRGELEEIFSERAETLTFAGRSDANFLDRQIDLRSARKVSEENTEREKNAWRSRNVGGNRITLRVISSCGRDRSIERTISLGSRNDHGARIESQAGGEERVA